VNSHRLSLNKRVWNKKSLETQEMLITIVGNCWSWFILCKYLPMNSIKKQFLCDIFKYKDIFWIHGPKKDKN